MKREDQALRLAQMMQNKVTAYPSYELALPLVEVGHAKLKKLSVDDIVLLGFDDLIFVLIDHEYICAEMAVKMISGSAYLEIINIVKKSVISSNSKKYKILKISFGKLQIRKLDVGYRIDITQRPLQNLTLMVEGKNYASGSLINVDGELAVKIEKVEE